jgi:hypothetical protein
MVLIDAEVSAIPDESSVAAESDEGIVDTFV